MKDATYFSWRLFKFGIYSRNYIKEGVWLMNFSGKIYKKQGKMEFLISMWIEKDGTIAYFY